MMIRFIKTKTPFILILVSFICSICSYFNWYNSAFVFLGDLVGYSLLTNAFMYAYYMNKHFCTSTKIAVIGLISLNLFNLIYLLFDVNGGMYDLIILAIVILIIIFLKFRKK